MLEYHQEDRSYIVRFDSSGGYQNRGELGEWNGEFAAPPLDHHEHTPAAYRLAPRNMVASGGDQITVMWLD